MSAENALPKAGRARQTVSLLICLAVIATLVFACAAMLLDLSDAWNTLGAKREALARFERSAGPRANAAAGTGEATSPFLPGSTITVAGAALQSRVEAAAQTAGVTILSSQVDLQGGGAAQGFVELDADFEIRESDLQGLLYDIEAGAPFLFVDSLELEASDTDRDTHGGHMRVRMGVTGQWRERS